MTQPLTPTEADKNAAQAWWNGTDGLRTAEFNSLAEAFARHAQAARLEGALAMREAAAEVATGYEEGLLPNDNWPPDEREGYENGVADTSSAVANAIRSLDPADMGGR